VTGDCHAGILWEPGAAMPPATRLLQKPVRVAGGTLKQRHDQHDREDDTDAFNVDFKRQDVLHELRDRARDNFSLLDAVSDD